MLIRTDIRTPFGGKPRLLPDVLRRKAVLRRRSAMMADKVSSLVEMSKQRAAELDAIVDNDGAGRDNRPNPWTDWISSGCCPNDNASGRARRAAWRAEMAEWHKGFNTNWKEHLEFLMDIANTVAAGLGYILLALAAIVWLSRP